MNLLFTQTGWCLSDKGVQIWFLTFSIFTVHQVSLALWFLIHKKQLSLKPYKYASPVKKPRVNFLLRWLCHRDRHSAPSARWILSAGCVMFVQRSLCPEHRRTRARCWLLAVRAITPHLLTSSVLLRYQNEDLAESIMNIDCATNHTDTVLYQLKGPPDRVCRLGPQRALLKFYCCPRFKVLNSTSPVSIKRIQKRKH